MAAGTPHDRQYRGYRINNAGRDDYHRSGVALIISSKAQRALLSYHPVDNRIITARFRTLTGEVTIVQVYPPADSSESAAVARASVAKATYCLGDDTSMSAMTNIYSA